MLFIIPFTVFSLIIITHSSWALTTKTPQEDLPTNIASEKQKETEDPISQDRHPKLRTLWAYKPESQTEVNKNAQNLIRVPYPMTKIAKTLANGFEPYYNKQGFFEPFERRSKPITLVAFRRNGLIPRTHVQPSEIRSALKIAELQSPYNDISTLWMDTPGEDAP